MQLEMIAILFEGEEYFQIIRKKKSRKSGIQKVSKIDAWKIF